MEITKKYYAIKERTDRNNFIKVYFYYDLGGMNYFTGRVKQRGYYLSVVPVERGGNMEGFTAFTGICELLHECTRKSANAEKIAAERIPMVEKDLIAYICNKYGYILED